MKKILISILTLFINVPIGASTMDDLGTQIKDKADLAISQFQERAGGKLDFSPASLSVVEDMLAEASNYYDKLSLEQIDSLCQLMGSYILYVGYKEYGGNFYWSDEQNQPVLVIGEPNFNIAIMTFNKVKGRLSGEQADNIPFFYKGFSDRVSQAKRGTNALYF